MAHLLNPPVIVPTGWECPRCSAVYSPLTAECRRCAPGPFSPILPMPVGPLADPDVFPEPRRWRYHVGAPCPKPRDCGCCGCSDALTLRLPPEMAGPHYQRIAKVGRDKWTEVFPGLQCKLAYEGTDATVLFRLTPPDGSDHD